MLLLLIAKVPEKDIIANYQVSYTYLMDNIKKMHEENPNLPKFLGSSKAEYMEKTLKLFKNKYKTIENYMKSIGLTNKDVKIISNKITTNLKF